MSTNFIKKNVMLNKTAIAKLFVFFNWPSYLAKIMLNCTNYFDVLSLRRKLAVAYASFLVRRKEALSTVGFRRSLFRYLRFDLLLKDRNVLNRGISGDSSFVTWTTSV